MRHSEKKMADKIDKYLVEEHLKCPICHGILEDARMLECGHSYCQKCIGAVIESKSGLQKMECPFCRQNVSIHDGTSSALKQNWIVNNILQVMATSGNDEGKTCKVHPGIDEDYYCESCEIVVCSHCVISDHFDHGSRPKKITEMVGPITERVQALLGKTDIWSAQHVVYEDAIADIKKIGSQAMDLVERDITQEYDTRLEQLNQSRERLVDHVTKSRKLFSERMDELLKTEGEYISNAKRCHKLANSKINSKTTTDVVRFFKDWSEELVKIMSHDVPDTANAESDLKMVRALYFEKSPVPSDSLYRDIGYIGNHLETDKVKTSSSSDKGEGEQDIEKKSFSSVSEEEDDDDDL